MATPELSYPLNPPNPSPPSSNPSPPSPPSPAPPPASPPGDPCASLNQINDNIEPQCDSLHFGTEKCQIDWAYFNTAPCGFGTKPYANGIGYAGSYFNAFDEKGFLRIEGEADSDAGEPNLYSYVGVGTAFEAYMYKDGLNLKGLLGGILGSRESCHIKIFKSTQETEIDYQGVTNLSSEGAQIFKSQLYKQTIEGFVKKYSYNEEWFGAETDIGKSIVWGGLNQSNYFRLMYSNAPEEKGFLEILHNGYSDYHQMMVKNTMINHYSQFASSSYYKNFVIDGTHGEDELYFGGVVVKALTNQNEASTYNSFYQNNYATLVSKNSESFVYLTADAGYAFLENKIAGSRGYGVDFGGNKYFDINTQATVYAQLQEGQDYMYVAPQDIPAKSDDHHYAGFHTFTYGKPLKKKVAFVSSADIDISDMDSNPCWADYPCSYDPAVDTVPCFAPLALGGPPNTDCKLSSFDVYAGSGPQSEIYQYQYGIDLKSYEANDGVRIYFDHASTAQCDCNGGSSAGFNARTADGYIQSYLLVNNGYGFQNIKYQGGCETRMAAGSSTADLTIYDNGGEKNINGGISSQQAYFGFKLNSSQNVFGFAKSDMVQWQLNHSSSYSFLETKSTEGKVQVSQGGKYGYIFSNDTVTQMTLYGANGYCEATAKGDEGKFQVSQGNNYGYHLATIEVVDSYCVHGGSKYAFSTAGTTEGKHQVSNGGNYGYLAATSSVVDLELFKGSNYSKIISDNSEGKVQVSQSSNYALMNAKAGYCSVYLSKGGAQINISTQDAQNKYISLRSVDVCEGGTTKQMIILASEPF